MYDVIVSGAGPAGSRCAEVFARNGYKVALIEKDTNWRKPCGGGVGNRIFKYYPQLRNRDIVKIRGIRMYSADYHELDHYFTDIKDYNTVMDRLELDNFVRDVAVDAGAELFDKNVSIDFVYKDGKKAGVKTKTSEGNKEYLGKLIVVADGMSSRLAVKSGLRGKWKSEELGIAKVAILEGENSLDPRYLYVFFREYKGYGWIFPISDKKFNIGCGTFGEDNMNYNLNEIYNEFINNPNVKKLIPASEYKQIWLGSSGVPSQGVQEKSLYSENIMLIGDASGFVSPISGEGIDSSLLSGQVAAEVGSEGLEIGDLSSKTLKKFKSDRRIKKIIRAFKLKNSMKEFFYENKGQNLNKVLKLAEEDEEFKKTVVNVFLLNETPPKDFFSKIQNATS